MRLFIIFLLISGGLFSCSNDDTDDMEVFEKANYSINSGTKPEIIDSEGETDSIQFMKFTYKGKSYKGMYINDSIQFDNDEVKLLFKNLTETPNIAIDIDSNQNITFFDSYNEMCLNNIVKNAVTRKTFSDTRYIDNVDIIFWDKAKGRKKGGDYLHLHLQGENRMSPQNAGIYPNRFLLSTSLLIERNMNKRISSCEFWRNFKDDPYLTGYGLLRPGQYRWITITFFEGNFTGRSIQVSDLSMKQHKYTDYFSSMNFNDQTSSITIDFHNDYD